MKKRILSIAIALLFLSILFIDLSWAKDSQSHEDSIIASYSASSQSSSSQHCKRIVSNINLPSLLRTLLFSGLKLDDYVLIKRQEGDICYIEVALKFQDENIKMVKADKDFSIKKLDKGFSVDPKTPDNQVDIVYKARGTALLKCEDWDFANDVCNGNWIYYMSTTPGKEYLITVKGNDPAYIDLLPDEAYDSDGNNVTVDVSYKDDGNEATSSGTYSYYVNATFNPGFSQSESIPYSEVGCRAYASFSTSNTNISFFYFNFTDSSWYKICGGTVTLGTSPTTYYCNATDFFNINKSRFRYACEIDTPSSWWGPPTIYIDWMYLGLNTNKTNECAYISDPGNYTLEQDVYHPATCFIIEAENVTFDCKGHVIDGDNSGMGIYVNDVDNVSIKNCVIKNHYYGIYTYYSDYNLSNKLNLTNITVFNNHYGIYGTNVVGSIINKLNSSDNTVGLYIHIFDNSTLSDSYFKDNDYGDLALNWTWDSNMSNLNIVGNLSSTYYSFELLGDTERVYTENLTIYHPAAALIVDNGKNNTFVNVTVGYEENGSEVSWYYVFTNDSKIDLYNFYINRSIVSLNSSSTSDFNSSFLWFIHDQPCGKLFFKYDEFTDNASKVVNEGYSIRADAQCTGDIIIADMPSFSSYAVTNLTYCGYLTIPNTEYNQTADLEGNKSDGACITIEKENITLNGNGHSITGNQSGTTYGISVGSTWNVLVENVKVRNYSYAINLYNDSNINITNVTLYNSTYGLSSYREVPSFSTSAIRIWNSVFYDLKYALSFTNTSFANFTDSSIENISDVAIWIANSTNNTLNNLTFRNLASSAISSSALYNTTISNLDIFNCSGDGLYSGYFYSSLYEYSVINSSKDAFSLDYAENSVIRNLSVEQTSASSFLKGKNVTLYNSYFYNIPGQYVYAIYSQNADNISIENNTMDLVYYGIGLENFNGTVKGNTIQNYNDSAIVILNSPKYMTIEENTLFNSTLSSKFGIYASNSSKVIIRNNTISHTDYHVYLTASSNFTIQENYFNDTITAWIPSIYLTNSYDNVIYNNVFCRVFYGIWIEGANATVYSNTFNLTNNSAIVIKNTALPTYFFDNFITSIISSGASSLYFSNANNSVIHSNRIQNVSDGVSLFSGFYNLFYNNLINSSSTPAYDENSSNYWNTSYNCSTSNIIGGACIGGNYYSDYTGEDQDMDGIGETTYTIWGSSGSVQDYLPLTNNASLKKCFYARIDNTNYSIQGNLYGNKSDGACITIEASNISILCNGYNITGSSNLEADATIGIHLSTSDSNITIRDCYIDNYSTGVNLYTGDEVTLENNTITNFGDIGLRLSNSANDVVVNNSIINADVYNSADVDYGLYLLGSGTNHLLFENNRIKNVPIALQTTTSPRYNTIRSNIISNVTHAYFIEEDNINFENNLISDCSSYCIVSNSNTNNLNISDFVYSSPYPLNLSSPTNVLLRNFAVGYDSVYGIINWSHVSLATANILLKENETIKLASDFVSLNTSNPLASQLNSSANISVKTYSCSNNVYKKEGFPMSRLDILNNGSVYSPAYTECNSDIRKFSVSSFSGYTTGVKEGEWWNCSYSSRIKFNIAYNGTINLTNYPVKIEINNSEYPPYLFAEDGRDIRVVDSNHVELPFYVERFNVNDSTVIYVSMNLTPNSLNSVYVYFGSNETTSLSNESKVFTNYMEAGTFTLPSQSSPHQWVLNVSFSRQIINPVLVLTPDVTYNGGEEATIRVRNLNSTGFEARQQEPSNRDDSHTTETVHYVVMPQGVYITPDGSMIEARKGVVSAASNGDGGSSTYATITFTKTMGDPVVVSSVIDYNSTNWIHTRERSITNTSFQISLEPQGNETASDVNASLVGWIAIDRNYGSWNGKYYEAYTTADAVTHNFYTISFKNNYSNPRFVASMQRVDGGDSAILRGRNIGSSSIEVKVQEDTTYDSETSHTSEPVGYFVFEDGLYPLTQYVENLSVIKDYSNITFNSTILSPEDESTFDVNESFNITCNISHVLCVGCSNDTTVYLQYFDSSSSNWVDASSSTVLSVNSNGISNTLACGNELNVTFTAKITQINTSLDVRCVLFTNNSAVAKSKNITVHVPDYNISIYDPEDLSIVYSGQQNPIKVEELFGKDFITKVNISINGTVYEMNETSPDNWTYIWDIPSSWPEGFVTIIAYGYLSNGSLVATDQIEVYVKKEVSCEWWNTSFGYKIDIIVKNPSSLELDDFIFAIEFDDSSFNYSLAQPDGSDLRLIENNRILPLWIEKWNDNGESIIWTRVNLSANNGKILSLYFGNETPVSSLSNKQEVFYYSSPKEVYYSLYPSSGNLNVSSYVDSNPVVAGSSSYTINRQQVVQTSYTTAMPINVSYPIAGSMIGNNRDSISPIAFAGKIFVYPFGARTSSTDQFIVYAPFSDATVSVYSNSNLVSTNSITAGSSSTITADISNYQNGIIISDQPVIIFHRDTSNRDSVVMHPAATEWYGISSSGYVSAYEDNTRVEVYRSDGSSATYTLNRNGYVYVGGGGSQGSGRAIRIKANKLVGALQRADGDGVEESTFLPLDELDTEYILTTSVQYIAIACPYNNTLIEVYNPSGSLLTQTTCTTPGSDYPGKAYFGTTSNGVNYLAGTLVNSSKPIYLYYEDVDSSDTSGEETNVLSWKQMRYYDPGVYYNLGPINNKTSDLEVMPFVVPYEKKECEDINFSVMIVNRQVNSSAFNVSFVVEFDNNTYLIERKYVSSLSCGGNITLNFSLNHTNKACGIGNKTLKVIADYDEDISESDETNNEYDNVVGYNRAMQLSCKNRLSINRNASALIILNKKVFDNSIYNITEVNLTYIEGTPALPSSCVELSPDYFSEIENNSYDRFNFTINASCAPNGTSRSAVRADGKDFASDHNLTSHICNGTLYKDENGTSFGSEWVDFGIVEPGGESLKNITIYNGDDAYNIVNISFLFSNMSADPSSNIIPSSNLSNITRLPIPHETEKNQTAILNITYSQIPGYYNGTLNIFFIYDDNVSTTVETFQKTKVRVPFIYDLDYDGHNEWLFDDDNDGDADPDSFQDNYNDTSASSLIYNSTTMSSSGSWGFLIDTVSNSEPDKFWDPTYYNNASGLVTNVSKQDCSNDGVDEFLIDNDDDSEYERIYISGNDYALPDIVAESISVYPKESNSSGNITINVTINNSGGYNASNFDVGLYINNSYVENQTVSNLGPNESINLTFNYSNSNSGNFSILIRADISEEVCESNDTNNGWNNSNNQIEDWFYANISHWHIFYGNISGDIILSDSTSIFYNWTWNGDGNVYVISSNSNPDFNNLLAISRNITNESSGSDFDELDSLLSMGGYSDSIRELYSNNDGSTPKNTTNITFLYYRINNVPVAPSSNYNTFFVTGILWDSSDDSDGQFDDSDNEDIIFVSPIMQNTTGSYGTYDYEIRIPENFDTYKGGSSVEVWVDLH